MINVQENFVLLFWDCDTQAYELKEMSIVLSRLSLAKGGREVFKMLFDSLTLNFLLKF